MRKAPPDSARTRAARGARQRAAAWAAAVLLCAVVAGANFALWRGLNPPVPAPDVAGPLAGLTYSPFRRWHDPAQGSQPSEPDITQDLQQLRRLTGRLRTYSASEWPALPGIAERLGLRLAAGVWLGEDKARNRREIEAVAAAAGRHSNIDRVIAGNETQLQRTLPQAELFQRLDELRRRLRVPVSTAEPWHVWLRRPELALHVDFITVHLLPYWEGAPASKAVDEAFERLELLRRRFPGKPIVVGEFGWPSGGAAQPRIDPTPEGKLRQRPLSGDASLEAHASPATQARVVREFAARARTLGWDYFLIEAYDQPWKRAVEGSAGAHWGVLDAQRAPKFAWVGPVTERPLWRTAALLSSLLGALLIGLCAWRLRRMRRGALVALAVGVQALLSAAVALAAWPPSQYLRWHELALWLLLAPTLGLIVATLLAQWLEFTEVFWAGSLHRRFGERRLRAGSTPPLVSVHLACCNEPPQMVIATLQSLRAMAYPALEIIVVDNNTADAALWQPVRDQVERWGDGPGPTLRFFHLPSWPGFKAGALNFALTQADVRAEVVAVVDADYKVRSDWLERLLGHFDDAGVAIVQSPQAHRDWERSRFRRLMNWEYEGFFRIGMHHRNERDAIIQHGTMTLIRASALRGVGGWSPACVCEDSELGLRLLQQGWHSVYVDAIAGQGLTPDDFAAYKAQRRRWALGAMQILRRHGRALLAPGGLSRRSEAAVQLRSAGGSSSGLRSTTPQVPRPGLSLGQRYHFIAGWLPWIGDALQLGCTLAALLWTLAALAAPAAFGLPGLVYVMPVLVLTLARLTLTPLLYWRRVRCPAIDVLGASLAGMALSHAIARGVLAGLVRKHAVFEVTRKGSRRGAASTLAAVREEATLALGLLVCIAAVGWRLGVELDHGGAWMLMQAALALPYLAALACHGVSAAAASAEPAPTRAAPARRSSVEPRTELNVSARSAQP